MTLDDFTAAVASGQDQPGTVVEAMGRLAQAVTGARLVTLTTVEPLDGSAERLWTNMPGPYPVSGRKPMNRTHWHDICIVRQQVFVANTYQEVAAALEDHALIRSLGCESCMNLPIVVAGRVIGTVNALDAAGHWTEARLSAVRTLALPGALTFQIVQALRQERQR